MPIQNTQQTKLVGRPIIFGEVLFDKFEDESTILGGAPFNVAWHLQGFGLNPLFISRIGNDNLGQLVLEKMNAWGMDCSGIQNDRVHPTGTVQVSIANNQPTFSIASDQAFDFIDQQSVASIIVNTPASVLYHGSLIARNTTSKITLDFLSKTLKLARFIDINLRAPWWEREEITSLVKGSRWLKLNFEELTELLDVKNASEERVETLAAEMHQQYNLEMLIVTLGNKGAFYMTKEATAHTNPVPVHTLVDTVGAGDAFSAIAILGLCSGWPAHTTLQRATTFASDICHQRGAIAETKTLYSSYKEQWNIK